MRVCSVVIGIEIANSFATNLFIFGISVRMIFSILVNWPMTKVPSKTMMKNLINKINMILVIF